MPTKLIARRFVRTTAIVVMGLMMMALSVAGCRQQGVTPENYSRIKRGMTFEQVVEILGRNYQKQRSGVSIGDLELSVESDVYVWRQEQRQIIVEFDDGLVEKATYRTVGATEPGELD